MQQLTSWALKCFPDIILEGFSLEMKPVALWEDITSMLLRCLTAPLVETPFLLFVRRSTKRRQLFWRLIRNISVYSFWHRIRQAAPGPPLSQQTSATSPRDPPREGRWKQSSETGRLQTMLFYPSHSRPRRGCYLSGMCVGQPGSWMGSRRRNFLQQGASLPS